MGECSKELKTLKTSELCVCVFFSSFFDSHKLIILCAFDTQVYVNKIDIEFICIAL